MKNSLVIKKIPDLSDHTSKLVFYASQKFLHIKAFIIFPKELENWLGNPIYSMSWYCYRTVSQTDNLNLDKRYSTIPVIQSLLPGVFINQILVKAFPIESKLVQNLSQWTMALLAPIHSLGINHWTASNLLLPDPCHNTTDTVWKQCCTAATFKSNQYIYITHTPHLNQAQDRLYTNIAKFLTSEGFSMKLSFCQM